MFEWDEAERRTNLSKHGLDFLRADLVFDGRPVLEVASGHAQEARIVTVVDLDGTVVTVVRRWRAERRRIISSRKARREEREAYRRLHP